MAQHSQALAAIAEEARAQLERVHKAREQAFPVTREIIQHCAGSIRAAHRREFEQSRTMLGRAGGQLGQIAAVLKDFTDLYYAGYVEDARKEYAEAWATLAFLSGDRLPGHKELGVDVAPYLNGLAEAASELRRSVLDALRRDDFGPCEGWMETMDEVYGLLVTMDFPEAVTGGLRRTTDQLRGVLERTRGDLTMALRQHALEQKLAEYQQRVDKA